MEFQPFKKIARLSRQCFITEKIDGTNGLVGISEVGVIPDGVNQPVRIVETKDGPVSIYAGSRSRWLQPGKTTDNFGFARWVLDNSDELLQLGPGYHHGEWWGQGINRGYGLDHRRFSLFNVSRWSGPTRGGAPECCSVVPILFEGIFDTMTVDASIRVLRYFGSLAAPGYDKPEGIVVYHTASGGFFKRTLENDEVPKTAANDNTPSLAGEAA